MLPIVHIAAAQHLHVKPYARYHQSVSSQNEPVFAVIPLTIRSGGTLDVFVTSLDKNFTLSSGIQYGLAVGYTFGKNLGIEIGANYFNTNKSFGDRDKIDWHYQSVNITPSFTFAFEHKKSMFIGKAGVLIGIARMDLYYPLRVGFGISGDFDTKINWGYTAGIEYDYLLSRHFSVTVEIGLEHYKYTPKKATFISHNDVAQVYKEFEIEYMKEETTEDIASPKQKRLEESVLFNSIYFGIGIKYKLF
jgi:hypothetical protein